MSEQFTLPERVTVEHGQEVVSLAAGLEGDAGLTLDASTVANIDGGAVLAFANIARTLSARGAKLGVVEPTADFVDAFSDLGLFEDLMKMEFRK